MGDVVSIAGQLKTMGAKASAARLAVDELLRYLETGLIEQGGLS